MKQTNPRDTLRQLGKAATRQNQQFVASLLVTVAILMKRQGLTKLDITPEELTFLKPGEQLEPIQSLTGGLAFEFKTTHVTPPLAKLPVPAAMTKSTKKAPRK